MKQFREVRQALGMTQQQFADKLRITPGALSKIEIDDRTPSEQLIHSLCVTFNVNEDWLRSGEGDMFVQKTDSALDQICREKNLSAAHRALLEAYMDLSPRARDLITEYIKDAAGRIVLAESKSHSSAVLAAFEACVQPADDANTSQR